MHHTLISYETVRNRTARNSLKLRLRGEGFKLIEMTRSFASIVADISPPRSGETFWIDCAREFKRMSTERDALIERIEKLTSFALSSSEFLRYRTHPFMSSYLLPLLHDAALQPIELLVYYSDERQWVSHAVSEASA